jgi:predicted AAA+ superfamily ATPase
VDFVIRRGPHIEKLVQVTYASGRDDVNKEEINPLIKASTELRCNDLLVITWNYEDELKLENRKIRLLPLWKWLTEITHIKQR